MAEPLNVEISNGNPYTVPAGKTAIFAAHWNSEGAGATLMVSGRVMGRFQTTFDQDTFTIKPLIAKAGDVVSISTTSETLPKVGIVGFLYSAT